MTTEWSSNSGQVEVKVNGERVGFAEPNQTLGSVASQFSNEHGLRTFSVLVNGTKADTASASQTLAALRATSVELVAKDARG